VLVIGAGEGDGAGGDLGVVAGIAARVAPGEVLEVVEVGFVLGHHHSISSVGSRSRSRTSARLTRLRAVG
jgi:hypothetical protein